MQMGVRHAAVWASDLQRSLAFYREVLGFEAYLDGDTDWAMLVRGNTSLSLMLRNKNAPEGGATHHLGLLLESPAEVDQWQARLRGDPRVQNCGPCKRHRDGSYGFYFQDPDGHRWELIFIPLYPQNLAVPPRALLLAAHGSHDPHWCANFEKLLDKVRRHLPTERVALGYLEAATPSINEAAEQLVQQGAHEVLVCPLFLASGAHVSSDLPRVVGELARQHPGCSFLLGKAAGEDDCVQDALLTAAVSAWKSAQF